MWRRIAIVAAAIGAVLATLPAVPAASAFPAAAYPAQNLGNRGSDVRAIQNLLHHHGLAVPRDGRFGVETRDGVRVIQRQAGLATTGIVDSATWRELVLPVRPGDEGPQVRALQLQLNQKRFAGLDVTGTFDAPTRLAIVAFQRHAGLAADGIAWRETWRNLLWHFERVDMRLASTCDYSTGNDTPTSQLANWGTAAAVGQLEAAAIDAHGRGLGVVAVGDLGFEHGGEIGGHTYHERGLEADLRPIRRDRAQCRWGTRYTGSSYDRAGTRELIRAIRSAAPGHVKLIYFNDPVLRSEGLTTYYPGHDDHLHVRWCEATHPDPIYAC
jgi:peptidoglycan hydrolase-like protein with peptidoglycan-binding domain